MKNTFTITDLRRDTTEEMITFTLEVKDKPGLIQGQIKYKIKKGTETELSSFSGLNDSHGYTEFTTLDLILDAETLKLYDEMADEYQDIATYSNQYQNNSISRVVIDVYSLRPEFDGWDAVCYVDQEIFEAVDEAVENNVTELLEGES